MFEYEKLKNAKSADPGIFLFHMIKEDYSLKLKLKNYQAKIGNPNP